jgi:hypothetical protein
MDEVYRRLANRRKFLVSRTDTTLNLDDNTSSIMTSFNSKVDLRPQWMIDDNDVPSGKPHVDAVLQPEQRSRGIPRGMPRLSPDQLQNVTLRRTGNRISIDAEGKRTISDSLNDNICKPPPRIIPIDDVLRYQVDTWSNDGNKTPLPPPPPPPMKKSATFPLPPKPYTYRPAPVVPTDTPLNMQRTDSYKSRRQSEENESIHSLQRQIEDLKLLLQSQIKGDNQRNSQAEVDAPPSYTGDVKTESVKTVAQPQHHEKSDEIDMDREFNERKLKNVNMKNWIDSLIDDRFERVSRIENNDRNEPESSDIKPHRYRSKERDQSRGRDKKRSSSKNSKFSKHSPESRSRSVESIRSTARSIKSVLFKRTEEEELLSEVEDDDIADVNAGDTGFIDLTSTKFTIHGPFVDKELNVFHAMCVQYQLAARMSFAKRTHFARTNPAHERVYALLGSNRRSSWTNRNSWDKASNDLQLLDFIFRKVIRSESRRIRKPVMELEHFTEGSTLNSGRFWKIMRSVFKKREHLVKVLGVDVDRFDDIK